MKLHLEQPINASADKVWTVLAHQFEDIAAWSDTVNESRALDRSEIPADVKPAAHAPALGRETIAGPGIKLKEVITAYSEDNRELTFEGIGLPRIMRFAKDTQRVTATGANTCLLTFDVHVEPKGAFKVINPLLKRRMASTFSKIQQELKHYTESN